MSKVSEKLTDDYQIETGVSIPGYRVDLYAFRDTTEMSVVAKSR